MQEYVFVGKSALSLPELYFELLLKMSKNLKRRHEYNIQNISMRCI